MYAMTFASFFFKCSTPQASLAFTLGNSNVVFTCGFSLSSAVCSAFNVFPLEARSASAVFLLIEVLR